MNKLYLTKAGGGRVAPVFGTLHRGGARHDNEHGRRRFWRGIESCCQWKLGPAYVPRARQQNCTVERKCLIADSKYCIRRGRSKQPTGKHGGFTRTFSSPVPKQQLCKRIPFCRWKKYNVYGQFCWCRDHILLPSACILTSPEVTAA